MYFKSDLSSFYFESVLSSYYTQDRRLIVIQNMVLSEYGDAAQITIRTWGMQLKQPQHGGCGSKPKVQSQRPLVHMC